MARGDVQAADQTLLIFENVEGVADRLAVFQGDGAGEGVGVEKALDELDGSAIVPVEFVAPVAGLLLPEAGGLAGRELLPVGGRAWQGGGGSRGAPHPRMHATDYA